MVINNCFPTSHYSLAKINSIGVLLDDLSHSDTIDILEQIVPYYWDKACTLQWVQQYSWRWAEMPTCNPASGGKEKLSNHWQLFVRGEQNQRLTIYGLETDQMRHLNTRYISEQLHVHNKIVLTVNRDFLITLLCHLLTPCTYSG